MLPISNQTNKFILLSVLCCSGLEGSENEVEKRDPPRGTGTKGTGVGGPVPKGKVADIIIRI